MILNNGLLLDSTKFNRLIFEESIEYLQNLPLVYDERVPDVPAEDDEIIATMTNRIFAADIIADDQEAAVYQAGQIDLVTNVIPNLKVGTRFGQAQINRLNRLARNAGTLGDRQAFTDWEVLTASRLVAGVRQRKNMLKCAMMLDGLNYDRLGVKIVGNWGTPSALKATPSVLWTNAATATPVTDILTMRQTAANTFGGRFDRMTLGTADLMLALNTTEVRNLIQGIVNSPIATTAFNIRQPQMRELFSRILDMTIVIDDATITTQNLDGTLATTKVLPLGKVILDSAAADGDQTQWDFGDAVVTESVVAGLVGDPDTFPAGEQRGPFGYYTGNPDLNPPNLTAWAVARGFPRKHNKYVNALLTVQ